MKIVANTSHWRTDDLRALVFACAKYYRLSLKSVRLSVTRWRGSSLVAHSAQIVYGMHHWSLSLARPQRFKPNVVESLANVDAPFGALSGPALEPVVATLLVFLRKIDSRAVAKKGSHPDVSGLVLRPITPVKKGRLTGSAYHQQKKERTEALLVRWQTKMKKAQTYVEKYEREIRYRERMIEKTLAEEAGKGTTADDGENV